MFENVAATLFFLFIGLACFADDLDTEIEDAKLRTSSGSKSLWSGSFSLNYAGASLAKPLSDERPQVGTFNIPDPVSAAGNFGVRYRLDKNKSLFFAGGYYRARPFSQGDHGHDEISTPQISLNNTYAWKSIQIGSSASVYVATLDTARDFGEIATAGYNLSALRYIGDTKVYGGMNVYAWYTKYTHDSRDMRDFQINYGASFGPQLQYNLSAKLNLYTALSLLNYFHYNSRDTWTFKKGHNTATAGLGWSVARDVYVSPYLGFEPDEISNEKVAVNFLVSLNLF